MNLMTRPVLRDCFICLKTDIIHGETVTILNLIHLRVIMKRKLHSMKGPSIRSAAPKLINSIGYNLVRMGARSVKCLSVVRGKEMFDIAHLEKNTMVL